MIVVFATLHARDGREKELEEVLRELVTKSRGEPGCLQYDLHVKLDDPGAFAFFEQWETPESLEAHFETDHFKAAGARAADLATGPATIDRYAQVT